jgi:hypothetical protein
MKRFLLLLALLLSGSSFRVLGAEKAAPAPDPVDATIDAIKHPVDWLTWGADLRLRNEFLDNSLSLTENDARHQQDYFRYRERLWVSLVPVTNVSLNVRVAAEQRDWMRPAFAKQFGYRRGLEGRYGIIDNANIKWANALDQPLTITAGRQDIMLGDPGNWWLVLDGTPYDGSWTTFFDAIRATYNAASIQTKLDLIYIYQNALPDEWVSTFGPSSKNKNSGLPAPGLAPYWLTEQNEQGAIVYLSNKSIKDMQIDGYFIYKHDDQENLIRSPYKTALGDNADIFTFGGKITGTPTPNWKYSVEAAYQCGWKEDPMVRNPVAAIESREIAAYGANASVTYLVKDSMDNQFSAVFEYLTGDNPKTPGRDEMFDVLWGRWPRWSELYIYSYANEAGGKIAQLNNILRVGPTWTITPVRNTTFSAAYNILLAPESTPTRTVAPALFSNDGHLRGHYVQAVLKHKFNKYISAHLWAEAVWQGDYYARRDLMTFLRAETMFTF